MKCLTRILSWVGLFLLPLAVFGQPLHAACTEKGWYKDPRQSWRFYAPSMAGHQIPSGLDAHTLGIYGSNGVIYWVCDQCRNVPGEKHCDLWPGLYKHPEDALAAELWAAYYVTPDQNGHPPPAAIKFHGHDGDPATYHGVTGGDQHYALITLDQMPDPPRATFKRSYGCGTITVPTTGTPIPRTGTPVPTPTKVAVPSRTPTRNPCGPVPHCKTPTPSPRSNTPTRVPTLQPTAVRTPTSVPTTATRIPTPPPTPKPWSILPSGCRAK